MPELTQNAEQPALDRLDDVDLAELRRWMDLHEPDSLTARLVTRALAELAERRAAVVGAQATGPDQDEPFVWVVTPTEDNADAGAVADHNEAAGLRDEVKRLRKDWDGAKRGWGEALAEGQSARAEVERLRARDAHLVRQQTNFVGQLRAALAGADEARAALAAAPGAGHGPKVEADVHGRLVVHLSGGGGIVSYPDDQPAYFAEIIAAYTALAAARKREVAQAQAPAGTDRTVLTVPPVGVKMTREYLCRAQQGTTGAESAALQHLIDECDRHRPTGSDGKHGDRHTPTCGCATQAQAPAGDDTGDDDEHDGPAVMEPPC